MLVLSRKVDQKIHLGQGITITVVRIKGHSVQIGVDAPPEVEILRGELNAPSSNPVKPDERRIDRPHRHSA
jgi:carbon storage regulator CsrA